MPRPKTRPVEQKGLKSRLARERWHFLVVALLVERGITAGRSRAARRGNAHLTEDLDDAVPATRAAPANRGFLANLRLRDGRQSPPAGEPEPLTDVPSTRRADHPVRVARAVGQAISRKVSRAQEPERDGSDRRERTTVLEPASMPPRRSLGVNLGFGQALAEAARRPTIARAGLGAALAAIVAVIVIVATGGGGSSSALASLGHLQSPGPPGRLGPQGIPVPNAAPLAPAASATAGTNVDGIPGCLHQAQLVVAYLGHVHLTVFVRGAPRQIPYGIGMTHGRAQSTPRGTLLSPGDCFSILHTNAADGMIDITSTKTHLFTLGNFFDVWGQPLSRDQVGPATGPVTAIVNGKPYRGNPRDILLPEHGQIQLEVGRPLVAPEQLPLNSSHDL